MQSLDGRGNTGPASGAYVVDSQAKLHLPRIGDVEIGDTTLGQLETSLEAAMNDRFLRGAVVSLTKTELP